ncbi:hypothetical protein O9992_19530 [Vibrio lentus]|nr:hypothetical protein [Vibrio lentus]
MTAPADSVALPFVLPVTKKRFASFDKGVHVVVDQRIHEYFMLVAPGSTTSSPTSMIEPTAMPL